MTSCLPLTRGHSPPRCISITGYALDAILDAAGIVEDSPMLFADLSLGAWVPHQIADELGIQLGLERAAMVQAPPIASSTADLIGVLIDRETAGHRPTQQAFANAQRIIAACRPAQWSIIVLAPLAGSGLGEDNEIFLALLSACAPDLFSIVVAGRQHPILPEHWLVTVREARPGDTVRPPLPPLPPIPGIVTEKLAARYPSAFETARLRPLGGGAWLIPPELRLGDADGRISDSEQAWLSEWHRTAADDWLGIFAAVKGGFPSDKLIAFAWRALGAGSHSLALHLVEAAIAGQHDDENRARMISIAQGMRIGIQDFQAVAREADPGIELTSEVRGRLLQHKGWGLVMTGRSEEALSYFESAKALLYTEPPTREFLYLLNINALVHFRRKDFARALELEDQIDQMLDQLEVPDWHLIYINALNTARLLLRQGQFDRAESLFSRAFDTSKGSWTVGDLVSQNIYAAQIAQGRGESHRVSSRWLNAALALASAPMPEAVPIRLARLILGHGNEPRHRLAESVSEAVYLKLLEVFDRQAPTVEPPTLLAIGDAPAELFADSRNAAVGCDDWAVLVSPIRVAPGHDGPAHRKLRSLILEILSDRNPLAEWNDAQTVLVDDQFGRGQPTGRGETRDLCIRTATSRAWFDGEPLVDIARNLELLSASLVRWGPAIDQVTLDEDHPHATFRRYRRPYAFTPGDVELVRHLAEPRSVKYLQDRVESPKAVIPRLRALERAGILSISLPDDGPRAALPASIEAFWRKGFVLIDDFASPDELAVLSDHVDEAIRKAAMDRGDRSALDFAYRGDAGRGELVWLRSPEDYVPELADCFAVHRAHKYGAALLKVTEEKIRVSTRVFAKPARTGSIVPWHQDAAYRPDDPERLSLNIWIPLDEATVESGCLHFVPRSHRGPIRQHCAYPQDPSGLTIEAAIPDERDVVACPVRVGGVSAHHCRTLHQSPANRSDRPRRALVVVCEVAER